MLFFFIDLIDCDYMFDYKYICNEGWIYLSGVQVLVKLLLMQWLCDVYQGIDSVGFVSGYCGSLLGGFDLELWCVCKYFDVVKVKFIFGLNEDLGVIMVWGIQQINLFFGVNVQGVFGMWYGKGLGVDCCGDVFKYVNVVGILCYGGVLVLVVDDYVCCSLILLYGSEDEFVSVMMLVLNLVGVQDIFDMGLLGWVMSCYIGCWVGFKMIVEIVELLVLVEVDLMVCCIVLLEDFEMFLGGFNICWLDLLLDQEMCLYCYVVKVVQVFVCVNGIDKVVMDVLCVWLGIVIIGKSYLDVLQVLEYLGLDEVVCVDIGICVYKVGMIWLLELQGIVCFVQGLEDIIVVEEKCVFIECQMKEQFFNWLVSWGQCLFIVGKYDESGEWILLFIGELILVIIVGVIGCCIQRFFNNVLIEQWLQWMQEKEVELVLLCVSFLCVLYYCFGCLYNIFINVLEGLWVLVGIGCYYMVIWMDCSIDIFIYMGGEGVIWVGQVLFIDILYVFQNLGDGIYFYSGLLVICQVVVVGVNIIYKIFYNDVVVMIGGQLVDGLLSVLDIVWQMCVEGIYIIVVLLDNIGKWIVQCEYFFSDVEFYDCSELDEVQKCLCEVKGVLILIYEQICVIEKCCCCKCGKLEDLQKWVMISLLVCEGCGDCGKKSFCVLVLLKEIEFGCKCEIDQFNCNKDYFCVNGFCLSFVIVYGGQLCKGSKCDVFMLLDNLLVLIFRGSLEQFWNILIIGVGGIGVVIIGVLLGMVGYLEGKGVIVFDQIGLVQKGGVVIMYICIVCCFEDIYVVCIVVGEVDLVLGCDMVVVNDYWVLLKVCVGCLQVVLNIYEVMLGIFIICLDMQFFVVDIIVGVCVVLGGQELLLFDVIQLVIVLLGDVIVVNLFIFGYVWQQGLVLLLFDLLMCVIEFNGVVVVMNQQVFVWGCLVVVDLQVVQQVVGLVYNCYIDIEFIFGLLYLLLLGEWEGNEWGVIVVLCNIGDECELCGLFLYGGDVVFLLLDDVCLLCLLDEMIECCVVFLVEYQDVVYVKCYCDLVVCVCVIEVDCIGGFIVLIEIVVCYLFKLMVYKDEYEVVCLYISGDFQCCLQQQFEGDYQFCFYLVLLLFVKKDEQGWLLKKEYGLWMFKVFGLLVKLKFLCGGCFDVFGCIGECCMECKLIVDYEVMVQVLLDGLEDDCLLLVVEIVSIFEYIRGFGYVKEVYFEQVKVCEMVLLVQWCNLKVLYIVQVV